MNLVNTVLLYRDNQLRADMLTISALKVIINKMEIDDTKQTFAFQDDAISTIYRRPIEQFERFAFIRKSAKFYDFDSTGVIQFSVILPFTSKEWNGLNCLNGYDLPPFYENKTRK